MNEITVNDILTSNIDIYDRLFVSIQAGLGKLQILIAVCDTDIQREQITSSYERELSLDLDTYRVNLDRLEPNLPYALATILPLQKNHGIVTVFGAENLGLSSQNDESLNKFFSCLQWTREALRQFKSPIILYLPSRIANELARRSPDFWSWRNGVFKFQSEPSLIVNELPNFRFSKKRLIITPAECGSGYTNTSIEHDFVLSQTDRENLG